MTGRPVVQTENCMHQVDKNHTSHSIMGLWGHQPENPSLLTHGHIYCPVLFTHTPAPLRLTLKNSKNEPLQTASENWQKPDQLCRTKRIHNPMCIYSLTLRKANGGLSAPGQALQTYDLENFLSREVRNMEQAYP